MLKAIVFTLFVIGPIFSSAASSELDFKEIKQSALLASASYGNQTSIEDQLKPIDYELVRQSELPGSAVSYFLARSSSGEQQLAFRGTSNLENVLVDLDIQLQMDEALGIQLHQGFAVAAKAAFDDVLPYLDRSKPIHTTGHSLGGAIAVIVGMHLQRENFLLEKIITFGQPKVTNVNGAGVLEELPLMRVVTPEDIVPLVPPLSPLQLQNLDIYWHNGLEVILVAQQQFALVRGLKSMMRATKFVSALPNEKNVKAHQMDTYLTLIESNQQGAQQVPYKTGISMFGFSLD